ncbi:MAG: hypothetical protein E7640_00425 [Ruminococcaceae bacterium]|nr:hypothetical protein [Oscillospiraceae bacterium]
MASEAKIAKYGKKKQYRKLYKIIQKGATYDTIDAVFEQLGTIKNKENFMKLCDMYQFKEPIVHLAVVKAICACAGPENIEIVRHYQNGETDPEAVEILKARVLELKRENDRIEAEKAKKKALI